MASPSRQAVKAKLRGPLIGSHRGKEPNKFQFDIVVDRVYGGSSSEYTIKWSRGVKAASTKRFLGDPKNKDGVAIGQKLSLLCTLYRAKSTTVCSFDAKDSKLSLVAVKEGKKADKTVGKVHFDLSQFVGIPCATTAHTFSFSPKTRVDVIITCTFVRVSNGSASSMGSGLSGMTGSSGEVELGNDDFADLDVSPVPSPTSGLGVEPLVNIKVPDVVQQDRPDDDLENVPGSTQVSHARSEEKEGDQAPETDLGPKTRKTKSKNKTEKEVASPRSSGILTFKSKARLTALESEVEELNLKLDNALRENDKGRVLLQISEDVVRELREKVDHGDEEGQPSSPSSPRKLQEQVELLQQKLTASCLETDQQKRSHDVRVSTLRHQVDATEGKNARLERENATLRGQVAVLDKAIDGSKKEEEREAGARQQLLKEVSQLQSENGDLKSTLRQRTECVTSLEGRIQNMGSETKILREKLEAHQRHSSEVKATYDELSSMYNALREEHTLLLERVKSPGFTEEPECPVSDPEQGSSAARKRSTGVLRKVLIRKQSNLDNVSGNQDELRKVDSELVQETQAKLQEIQTQLAEEQRNLLDEKNLSASLRSEVSEMLVKVSDLERENHRLTERLESSQTRALLASEELEVSEAKVRKHEKEIDSLQKAVQATPTKHHNEALSNNISECTINFTTEKGSVAADLQQQNKKLEESLAESALREEKYELEILRLTQIVDGLVNKVSETGYHSKKVSATEQKRRPSESGDLTDFSTEAQDDAERGHSLQGSHVNNTLQRDFCRSKSQDEIQLSRSGHSLRRLSLAESGYAKPSSDFISSSRVREEDLFEKITDGGLLSMLVETKMKLAIAEEEKLSLEHLIRKVREGDKHIQNKLAEHASRLEIKLNQATVLLSHLKEEQEAASPAEAKLRGSARSSVHSARARSSDPVSE